MSNVLTSCGAANIQLEQDYCLKFSNVQIGMPLVTIEHHDLSAAPLSDEIEMSIDTWYRYTQTETASWKYVGASYDAAQQKAKSLRTMLTYQTHEWEYGAHLSNGHMEYGFYPGKQYSKLDSEVTVQKGSSGEMYDVIVHAQMESENWAKEPLSTLSLNTPLRTVLDGFTEFSEYPSGWSTGIQINEASISNIVLVQAPSRERRAELIGNEILPMGWSGGILSDITIPEFYKITDTYRCSVKYEGMTLSACRALYSSLNTANGWWLSSYQWVYEPDYTYGATCRWVQDPLHRVQWQCLNDFSTQHVGGNMYTVTLQLKAEIDQYVTNPNSASPPYANGYPPLWASGAIPGLSRFL